MASLLYHISHSTKNSCVFVKMKVKLEYEEIHQVVVIGAAAHFPQDNVPIVDELLRISVVQDNLLKSRVVCYGLVPGVHKKYL